MCSAPCCSRSNRCLQADSPAENLMLVSRDLAPPISCPPTWHAGTKFIPARLLREDAPHGLRVHDSHAEALARRALLRWIYSQLLLALDGEEQQNRVGHQAAGQPASTTRAPCSRWISAEQGQAKQVLPPATYTNNTTRAACAACSASSPRRRRAAPRCIRGQGRARPTQRRANS